MGVLVVVLYILGGVAGSVAIGRSRNSAPDPASYRLQAGEMIVSSQHRSGWSVRAYTMLTAGLYYFWWRVAAMALTDRRIIDIQGILRRSERSLPLQFLQGASVHRDAFLVASVHISTAGSGNSLSSLSPLAFVDAQVLSDRILNAALPAAHAA
jgi:hypothetical protein